MRYALALATALAASGARAQTPVTASDAIPLHDVEKACAGLADRTPKDGLTTRNATLAVCLEAEQQGYDTSRLGWPELPPEQRRECLQHAGSFNLPNYYRALGICVEGKLVAGAVARDKHQNPPRFRY